MSNCCDMWASEADDISGILPEDIKFCPWCGTRRPPNSVERLRKQGIYEVVHGHGVVSRWDKDPEGVGMTRFGPCGVCTSSPQMTRRCMNCGRFYCGSCQNPQMSYVCKKC